MTRLARWIGRRVRHWWHGVYQRYLPTPSVAAGRARRDARAEFDTIARLRPILAGASATYIKLVERSGAGGVSDDVLVEAAESAGAAAQALKRIARPALRNPNRQEYIEGVFAYADALVAAIQRMVVICRQLWTARHKKDLASELLLNGAKDQLMIGLLAQESAFQNASADAIRPANPQYFLTRARAVLNTAMIHLLERAGTAGDPLAPPELGLARRAVEEAEALLRKALVAAPGYYEWLSRHGGETPPADPAPMRTALRALRLGLEEAIATERDIAEGTRTLIAALEGTSSLAMRLGHPPHAHATIASLVARRLAAPSAVRTS